MLTKLHGDLLEHMKPDATPRIHQTKVSATPLYQSGSLHDICTIIFGSLRGGI